MHATGLPKPTVEKVPQKIRGNMSTRVCPKCQQNYPLDVTFCPKDGTSLNDVVLKAGLEIESYTLEKRIGIGGMGEVWSAFNAKINRRAAIKFLSKKMSANRDVVTRFLNEARAANSIQQRNIIDIFSFGELSDGRPYFIMEFLIGESIKDRIKKGPLPLSEIAEIMPGICKALQAAHDQGIVHRDLKPDNIFLILEEGEKPFPKVLDFGIAKLTDVDADGNDKGFTKTSTMMGTPLYMSPEQCKGAKRLDHRSDIYSLGIILFELLTGRTPFENPNEEGFGGLLTRHMYVPAPVPSKMVKGRKIPEEVETVVLKVLSKKPEQRHQSCKEFLGDLLIAIEKFKGETAKDIAGAKPNFEVNFDTTEEAIKKQATMELNSVASDSQVEADQVKNTIVTPDFEQRPNTGSIHAEIAEPALPPTKKNNVAVFAFVGLLLAGLVVFMALPKSNQTQPGNQPPINNPTPPPVLVPSVDIPKPSDPKPNSPTLTPEPTTIPTPPPDKPVVKPPPTGKSKPTETPKNKQPLVPFE
jgi:serine/threonine protein kinase